MFNLHANIQNPMKSKIEKQSLMTNMFKFSRNLKAQNIMMTYEKSLDSTNRILSPLDQRLRALCDI